MELNLVLWTSYLLLLFCYDDNFIGDRHPATAGHDLRNLCVDKIFRVKS
ncbi:MAG: hypothetical protein LBK58_00270 [Prevotellaceae bacterium]|nr:hypothetical protein [Prevotellaceae bacterium]